MKTQKEKAKTVVQVNEFSIGNGVIEYMIDVLFINGKRNGYGIEQCGDTLTVGELIEELKDYDSDLPVYLNNDGGYTFGSIEKDDIYEGNAEE